MPKNTDTQIASDWQEFDITLPPYRELFRLHTWLENTFESMAHLDGGSPKLIWGALQSTSCLVELALEREQLTYGEMLRAIHAGQFD